MAEISKCLMNFFAITLAGKVDGCGHGESISGEDYVKCWMCLILCMYRLMWAEKAWGASKRFYFMAKGTINCSKKSFVPSHVIFQNSLSLFVLAL